jgi:hypothetical protein
MMEVVVGKLPHATTSPVLEETAPSFVTFFLEPWSKPDADLPPQGVLVRTAIDGASPRHGEHIPKVPNHFPQPHMAIPLSSLASNGGFHH